MNPTYFFISFLVLVCQMSTLALVKAGIPLNEKLISYWSFDQPAGNTVHDDSKNGRKGLLKGPQWVAGKYGNALKFDGKDDYVDLVPTSAKLFDNVKTFTITAWVTPIHKSSTHWPAIIHKYEGSKWNDMPWVGYNEAKDEWAWEITTNKFENVYHDTGVKVSFDVFSYVAFTVDIPNKVSKFYLNGEMKEKFDLPVAGARMSANPNGESSKIVIGAIRGWGNIPEANNWRGIIDELRIWNRVLTAKKIPKDM